MAEVPKYTPIGHGLWSWEPWTSLDNDARMLWLAFYTSSEAKSGVPGLWRGCIYVMSAVTGMNPNVAHNALDRMLERGLVQFDSKNRLVRLTQLPDVLDRAHTEQAIHGWWGRFRTLPQVPLRDAHVPTLWWMVDGGKKNDKMLDVWKKTFGTIVVPTRLPVFKPLSSSDTGVSGQPSLFGPDGPIFNKNNQAGPTPVGPDPEQDLDLVKGEADQITKVRPLHLQLVPDHEREPGNRLALDAQDAATKARHDHAAELHAAVYEAATASGASFLLTTQTTTKDS